MTASRWLSLEGGTIQGLLGENGAGKTTLMKILSGYQTHDAGDVILDGGRARFHSPEQAIAAGIGMLHQDPLDVPALNVLDNFMLGRENRLRQRRNEAKRELLTLCQRFGFDLDPEALTGSLTVGERQQLELVRLLAVGCAGDHPGRAHHRHLGAAKGTALSGVARVGRRRALGDFRLAQAGRGGRAV